jgi:DnaJ like chaperone protein
MMALVRRLLVLILGPLSRAEQFIESTFAVMGAICRSDGRVTPQEIRVAETMLDRLAVFGEERLRSVLAFHRGAAPGFALDAELVRLRRAIRGRRELIEIFLEVQFGAIRADGYVDPQEDRLLQRIARSLGFSALDMERIRASLHEDREPPDAAARARPEPAETLEADYLLLGVSGSASGAEIKLAYRRMMHRNHPDKLAARGLPDSMRPLAERRTREIAAAYERIRQARGLGR